MSNTFLISKKEMFPIGLILLLTLFRLIPHPWNFTPIIAVAIMSSFLFRNIYLSLLVLTLSMFLADLFLGFYKDMFFTYASLFLITFVFFSISKKINVKNLFIFGFFGSLIFYLISNFGVWMLSGMYEKSLNGLVTCYILAIPFFKNTLMSTIIFSYIAFFANNFYKKKLA